MIFRYVAKIVIKLWLIKQKAPIIGNVCTVKGLIKEKMVIIDFLVYKTNLMFVEIALNLFSIQINCSINSLYSVEFVNSNYKMLRDGVKIGNAINAMLITRPRKQKED